ncbi:hypothetical protein EDC01DRAFT_748246 [Geopyxis carbonaria]|nr:hypothetical protein EDC01DRAFT_748246 [Geopyxis carbonaria]
MKLSHLLPLLLPLAMAFAPDSFLHPPASAGAHVLWMHMNGHISAPGITSDLRAMAASGYTGFTLFNVGVGIPAGPISYGSEEWFSLLRHALDASEDAGLTEVWMHQSPGYSGVGGPWVGPERGMQEVVFTETRIAAGAAVGGAGVRLERPLSKGGWYQDIAALAYPALPEETGNDVFRAELAAVTLDGAKVPRDIVQGIALDRPLRLDSAASVLMFEMKRPFTASAVSVFRLPETPEDTFDGSRDYPATWTLQASNDSAAWTTLATFGGPALRKMDAPAVASFKATAARWFRLRPSRWNWVVGVELHAGPRLEAWNYKAHAAAGTVPDPAAVVENKFGGSVIDPDEVVDVSEFLRNGTLVWTPPTNGSWTVVRFGHTATLQDMPAAPGSVESGLAVDLFSKPALDYHIAQHVLPIVHRLGPHVGKLFRGFETDSYEIGMQNWGHNFTAQFRQLRGYDIGPWLLCASGRVLHSPAATEQFLFDFRRTHADLVATQHYAHLRQRLNDLGLRFATEPYGDGPFDTMQVAAAADIAFGEFWARNTYGADAYSQLGASTALQQTLVPAESFTGQPKTSKWTEHPYALKAASDRRFALGVNRLLLHQYAHNPESRSVPGMTMGPFGAHFSRKVTWSAQAVGWTGYLRRAQWVLQQGRRVVDVACWGGEEARPKTTETYAPPCAVPEAWGADILGTEALMRLRCEAARAVLPGSDVSYALVSAPAMNAATAPLLAHLLSLAAAGCNIALNGPPPRRSLSLTPSTASVATRAAQLWAAPNIHNASTTSTVAILASLAVPPSFTFTALENDAAVYGLHKTLPGGTEYFFVSNGQRAPVHAVVSLRTTSTPELWHPETGLVSSCLFSHSDSRTLVPLNLEPSESVFIVFRPHAHNDSGGAVTAITRNGTSLLQTTPYPAAIPTPYENITSTFTYTFWARADTFRLGTVGHILYPAPTTTPGHAAVGFALGTNGFTITEATTGAPAAVWTLDIPLSGWTAVAVVYTANTPYVYLNGVLAATGPRSAHTVHPGARTPDSPPLAKSRFEGDVLDLTLHDTALSDAAVKARFDAGAPGWRAHAVRDVGGGRVLVRENGEYTITASATTRTVAVTAAVATPLSTLQPWSVTFPSSSKIAGPVTMQNLSSLHLHADFDVAHFSGTATYTTSFSLPPLSPLPRSHPRLNAQRYLNLGLVESLASVSINNAPPTLLWKPPFELPLPASLGRGPHTLRIEVTNLWPNRLIGDEALPVEAVFNGTRENFGVVEMPGWVQDGEQEGEGDGGDGGQEGEGEEGEKGWEKEGERVTFTTWRGYKGGEPLFASGLLGPVEVTGGVVIQV